MYCIKCGAELPNDANFCMKCGKPQDGPTNPQSDRPEQMKRQSNWEFRDFTIPLNTSHKSKDQWGDADIIILNYMQVLSKDGWEPDEPTTISAFRSASGWRGRIKDRPIANDTSITSLFSLGAWGRAWKNEAVPKDLISITLRFKRPNP